MFNDIPITVLPETNTYQESIKLFSKSLQTLNGVISETIVSKISKYYTTYRVVLRRNEHQNLLNKIRLFGSQDIQEDIRVIQPLFATKIDGIITSAYTISIDCSNLQNFKYVALMHHTDTEVTIYEVDFCSGSELTLKTEINQKYIGQVFVFPCFTGIIVYAHETSSSNYRYSEHMVSIKEI